MLGEMICICKREHNIPQYRVLSPSEPSQQRQWQEQAFWDSVGFDLVPKERKRDEGTHSRERGPSGQNPRCRPRRGCIGKSEDFCGCRLIQRHLGEVTQSGTLTFKAGCWELQRFGDSVVFQENVLAAACRIKRGETVKSEKTEPFQESRDGQSWPRLECC